MNPGTALIVLGSGSGGNSFALVCDGALLLLDAGFSAREIERRLAVAGIDLAALVGIALTHEHGDHSSGAIRLAARCRVPLLASFGTWRRLCGDREPCEVILLGSRGGVTLGPFTISACPTSHDAAEPVALGVVTCDGLSIGVAYDLGRLTQAVRFFLRGRHCLVLEANHDEVLLRTSGYPPVVQQRIAGAGGHLSNLDAARLLEELHHDGLMTVVLAHLSQRCNSAAGALAQVTPALASRGFRGQLYAAIQDGPMAAMPIIGPVQTSLF